MVENLAMETKTAMLKKMVQNLMEIENQQNAVILREENTTKRNHLMKANK